jgi:hypothetical protein
MAAKKDKREKRKSTARRRAEQKATGFVTSTVIVPEGAGFFEFKAGIHTFDILPYVVKQSNNFANEGELHYEKTYYRYRKLGADDKSYIALAKTFGKKDPVKEWCDAQERNPDADPDIIKSLKPQERQLFLVRDHSEPDKIKLLDVAYWNFGRLLDERIQNCPEDLDWDMFYFPDDDGLSLRVTVGEDSFAGNKYDRAIAIDFIPRKVPLPKQFAHHGICLDELLVEKSYDELKRIFLCISDDDPLPDKVAGPKSPVSEAKEAKKSDKPPSIGNCPTASDYGLKVGTVVYYQSHKCSIRKISGDGTSLTLLDEENDDIHRGVGADEVVVRDGSDDDDGVPFKSEAPEAEQTTSVTSSDDEWGF